MSLETGLVCFTPRQGFSTPSCVLRKDKCISWLAHPGLRCSSLLGHGLPLKPKGQLQELATSPCVATLRGEMGGWRDMTSTLLFMACLCSWDNSHF